MRDPARIDEILDLLRTVWLKNPDLRLGQLVVSAANPTEPCPKVFYVEDAQLSKALQRMLSQDLTGSA